MAAGGALPMAAVGAIVGVASLLLILLLLLVLRRRRNAKLDAVSDGEEEEQVPFEAISGGLTTFEGAEWENVLDPEIHMSQTASFMRDMWIDAAE
jgi:hypothetical protein